MGMAKTKAMARSYVWWPKMNEDIENLIKGCDACLSVLPNPAKAPVINYDVTDEPWQRVHIDYAGPFVNRHFLIVIDSHSKWIEVSISKNATTEHSIKFLNSIFSRFGMPKKLVSDNGSQFTSVIFEAFLTSYGIKHELIAPQHPASNGAAENAVKSVKNALKKALYNGSENDIEKFLNKFLLDYRQTPHCTTGLSPSDCLFKFKPRTQLDLLKPPSKKNLKKEIGKSKYKIDDDVIVKIYKNNRFNWKNACIVKVLGPRNCLCRLTNSNRVIKRHVNQIRPRKYNNANEIHHGNKLLTSQSINKSDANENQNLIYFNFNNNLDDDAVTLDDSNHENMFYDVPSKDCTLLNSNETEDPVNDDNEIVDNVSTNLYINDNLPFAFVDINNSSNVEDHAVNKNYNLRDRLSIKKPDRFED